MESYMFTIQELASLMKDATVQLTNSNCPYCGSYIGTDKYLETKDITDWLLSRLGSGSEK